MDYSYYNWLKLMKNSDLQSKCKLVCYCLGSYMNNENNIAWPSLPVICRETGLSLSTVMRAIKELVSLGWLSVKKNYHKKNSAGGGQYNNEYTAIIPPEIILEVHHPKLREQKSDIEGGVTVTERGCHTDSKGVSPRHTNNNTNIKVNNNSANFEKFWKNNPRKDDKKKAEVSFNKLSDKNQLLAIKDIKTRYSETDKKFIPLPTTYLNGERWNDESGDKVVPDYAI